MATNHNLLESAFRFYGEREIPGKGRNPEIGAMIDRWMGTKRGIEDDRLAWCSVFMNDVAFFASREWSGKLNARSWLSVGEEIDRHSVKIGDVCVLWRSSPQSWKGHVGLVVRLDWDKNLVWLLGGNQSNRVTIRAYRVERILGFRRLGTRFGDSKE